MLDWRPLRKTNAEEPNLFQFWCFPMRARMERGMATLRRMQRIPRAHCYCVQSAAATEMAVFTLSSSNRLTLREIQALPVRLRLYLMTRMHRQFNRCRPKLRQHRHSALLTGGVLRLATLLSQTTEHRNQDNSG